MKTNVNSSLKTTENRCGKNQVAGYTDKLSLACQAIYDKNLILKEHQSNLLEDLKNPETVTAGFNPDVIAKALLEAEVLAQNIIKDAQKEAIKVIEQAQKIVDDAYIESANIRLQTQKMVVDAYTHRARATAQAQKIIADATAEASNIAARAKWDLDEAPAAQETTAEKDLSISKSSNSQIISG